MSFHHTRLETTILLAFRQALRDRRPAVAEHLLEALETLQQDCSRGSPLAEAYLSILRMPSGNRVSWRIRGIQRAVAGKSSVPLNRR